MEHQIVAAIPAYNCAAMVGEVVQGCLRHVRHVVVVDDGSTDATARVAEDAGARVERLPVNRGKGFALRRAIALALAEAPAAVALLDADGQHDPSDLPRLITAWERGEGDLIVGSRMEDSAAIPRPRFWNNYIGSRILSWMAGLELEDSQCGYRLVAADLLCRLGLTADGYAIESEMLLKAARLRAKVAHAPVKTIYDGAPSYFRPLVDTMRISFASVYYKVFDDA